VHSRADLTSASGANDLLFNRIFTMARFTTPPLLLLALAAVPAAADIQLIDLYYETRAQQVAPTPPATSYATFASTVYTSDPAEIGSVTGTAPDLQTLPFIRFENGSHRWFAGTYATEAALMDAVPPGLYTFDIAGGTLGDVSATVDQPYDGNWPPQIPAFTPGTFASFAAVDPGQDLTINFNAFTPGLNANSVFSTVNINNADFSVFVGYFIPAGGTSVLIPAGTLTPGDTFTVSLGFISQERHYGAAFGTATTYVGFLRYTNAAMQTTGSACGSVDFDGDGDEGTDSDIEAFFAAIGGGECATGTCGSIDFDGDGDEGTDSDIEAFFRVIGGGSCTP